MAHRTTWVCPERKQEHRDKYGNIRRNPYRNQIDYILVKTQHRNMLQNSRSYSGMNTSTDHRLVVANMKLTWYKCFETNKKEERYDLEQLKTPAKHRAFNTGIESLYNEKTRMVAEIRIFTSSIWPALQHFSHVRCRLPALTRHGYASPSFEHCS